MLRRGLVTASVVLLLLGLAAPVVAQSSVSGGVQGTVKDTQGGALPGVTVTALSEALVAGRLDTVTDVQGGFRFPSLPVGAYAFEVELAGFVKVRQEDVRVRLGQALTLDVTLAPAQLTDEITVTAEAPVVSVVENAVASYIDAEFISRQPVSRDYYRVLAATPGVNPTGTTGGGMQAYGGTQQRQNAYTLDGVSVEDPGSGQYWLLPSINWMEEIQVAGLGAAAEYGGYTGGVINAVTKSGGNVVRGTVDVFYEPDSWVADNTDDTSVEEKYELRDVSVSVGGPLIKDRLWYFISGEYYREERTPYGALDTSDRKLPRYLGKLTYQLSEGNRFALTLEHDHVVNERRGIAIDVLPSGSSKQDGPNTTAGISWESLVNASNFFTVKLTGFDGRDDYLPYDGMDTPGRYDYETASYWANPATVDLSYRSLKNLDATWSLFADALLGSTDSHTFKFGAGYEQAKVADTWFKPGGFSYNDDSSLCDSWEAYLADPTCGRSEIEYGIGEYFLRGEHDGISAYAQDSMRLGPLTVNAGVRYGAYQAGFTHGRKDVYEVDFVDPRIGVVWDVLGTGRSALKVHWGRYHDSMYTWLYDREASGNAARPEYLCYWDGTEYTDCDEPTLIAARITDDPKHMYVDETLLSFEQQLGRSIAVGVDLIDRSFKDIFALTNANDDYEAFTVPNPVAGGDLTVYNLLSEQDWYLTSARGAYRDYQSVVLRFDRRYTDGWMVKASVVWSDLEGNIAANHGYSWEFRDRNGRINSDGTMEGFSEWEVKFSGSVDLPYGFVASGFYTFLSGQYWTPYARIRTGLDYNWSTGRSVNLTERGSEQLDDRSLVDLRLAWATKLSGIGLTLSLEGFNVLNEDTVLAVYDRYGDYRSSGWRTNSAFGTPYAYERPREIRAGVRIDF